MWENPEHHKEEQEQEQEKEGKKKGVGEEKGMPREYVDFVNQGRKNGVLYGYHDFLD